MTIKNQYLLPQVDNIQEQLRKTIIFIQLDIRDAYYLIRIAESKK
jgi:ABC-type proline/glycine betaine transport system ATPase subunit